MISVSSSKLSLSQKSAKVLAAVVLLLFCCQSTLASPLGGGMPRPSSSSVNSNDQLESKSRSGPAEVLLVEDDSSAGNPLPLTMEALENRLVARQPPVRMLRSPSAAVPPMFFEQEEESSEAAPSNARNIASPEQQEQMARLLAQYFRLTNGGAGSNRFPRRVSSTSKRAAAMGVDLPDYILHINKGRNFDFSTFREKMQKSG